MKTKLSALVDGELRGKELRAHLGCLKSDAELRRAWDTYHLIGDALRGHFSPGCSSRVAARLVEEPTVLAPRSDVAVMARLARYAVSAAAVSAGVALVVWTALPVMRGEPQIAANSAAAPAAGASESEPGARRASIEDENYLLAHQPYSHTGTVQGVATYVRAVSEPREAERK
jgi:sigma-E factor negative regulatory protein RseA